MPNKARKKAPNEEFLLDADADQQDQTSQEVRLVFHMAVELVCARSGPFNIQRKTFVLIESSPTPPCTAKVSGSHLLVLVGKTEEGKKRGLLQ